MHEFYNKPEAHPPFSLSDHNSILVSPKIRDPGTNKGKIIIKRDTRKSSKVAMGRFLGFIDWHPLSVPYTPVKTCGTYSARPFTQAYTFLCRSKGQKFAVPTPHG